jgi:hypothetical protein
MPVFNKALELKTSVTAELNDFNKKVAQLMQARQGEFQ